MILVASFPCSGTAETVAEADSAISWEWSLVYINRIELLRRSEPFPWNDPRQDTHLNDRVSILMHTSPLKKMNIFLKGATGLRKVEAGLYSNRFFLEQGDIRYSLPDRDFSVRLFLRERIFRTGNRLLPLVSNDTPMLYRRGEGLALDACVRRVLWLSYRHAAFYEEDRIEKNGGLPSFSAAGEYMNLFECEVRGEFWHLGLIVSETRSAIHPDAVMAGTGLGIGIGGTDLLVEFAKSAPGRWNEIGIGRFIDFDMGNGKWGSISRVFPDDIVFSAEISGLEYDLSGRGKMGVIPSYRYYGKDFIWRPGEFAGGLVKSSIMTWWRHSTLAIMTALEASDMYDSYTSERTTSLEGMLRARLKGGFESTGRVILRDGKGSVLVLSFIDDNSLTRMRVSARLDGVGRENDFSFLTEGSMNLNNSWALRSVLFLQGSLESLYSMELEFRPSKRFLFKAAFGSFVPGGEANMLIHDHYPSLLDKERRISVYTRIWLGEMGN